MSKAEQVYSFVDYKLQGIYRSGSSQAASLAKLRRGVGKQPGASSDVWEITLAEMPESLFGYRGEPSYAEWAIHLALTLFAIHQQGKSEAVNAPGISFGQAVSRLIEPDRKNESGIKSRFDAVMTAKSIDRFAHYTRALVQLMRAKDVKMDYPLFAKDIFDYQFNADRVRLRWAEAYYRVDISSEMTES